MHIEGGLINAVHNTRGFTSMHACYDAGAEEIARTNAQIREMLPPLLKAADAVGEGVPMAALSLGAQRVSKMEGRGRTRVCVCVCVCDPV